MFDTLIEESVMETKIQLLTKLERALGEYLSGEELAKSLNVSRATIWKAVEALRADGYKIDAVKNRGYKLNTQLDVINASEILAHCNNRSLYVDVYPSLPSTNDTAKQYALSGKGEGVIIATEQTGGKGRLGRTFFSPDKSGIYMSFLLRPTLPAEKAISLTTMAAVAVAQAIEEIVGIKADIKWVNDVFVDSKKTCGILTEAAISMETGSLDYAIVGIGINVYPPKDGFPSEISNIAGYLLQTQAIGAKNKLVARIINLFFDYYTSQNMAYVAEYRKRSFVIGKEITVINSGSFCNATALSVDDNCRLIVRYDSGEIATLSSGEISIRLK